MFLFIFFFQDNKATHLLQTETKVDYDKWRSASYGVNRLIGMVQFMESEDWSVRLPEMKEFLELCDKQRNNSFAETFPEMKDIFKDIHNLDKNFSKT